MRPNWYIFRHSLATLSKTGYGDQILTASILPDYTEPIRKMAQFLKSVKESSNFSSELLRCKQTTAIITEVTGKTFTTDPRLNEYYDETFSALYKRVKELTLEIEKTGIENILVCTHGAVTAAMKHIILTGSFLEKDLMDYPQCGELLIIKNQKAEFIDFN